MLVTETGPIKGQSEKNFRFHKWEVMAALMVGIMLSPLNVMFTSVALPTMRDYFHLNIEQAAWIGTAYFIPSVALMPLQSQLGRRWGLRRTYGLGLLLLSGGAILTALAPSYEWVLATRVLQGIGWSALYPLALILINRQYPAGRRGEMVGIWESSVGLTTIFSPVIAGVLVLWLGWQSLYIFIGLVAAGGFLLTRFALPSFTPIKSEQSTQWINVIGLTLALTLSLLGITRRIPSVFLLSILIWIIWTFTSRRLKKPSIPPAIFGNIRFMAASLAANIRMLVAIGVLTALPLFFEDVQGLSPAQVGGLLVIYSLFLFLGSWPGGRWADLTIPAFPGIAGYLAMIAGTLMLVGLGLELVVWFIAIALALRGLGAGLSQAPYAKAATEAVPSNLTQTAAGLYGTIRYSGLALGTAIVGIFLQFRLAYFEVLPSSRGPLNAYRELWLVLTAILLVGLVATLVMARSRPVLSPEVKG